MSKGDILTARERALEEGYNQTYIVLNKGAGELSNVPEEGHEVLFRCGNWCYRGLVQFNDLRINTEELPLLIPVLQKQQGSLRYYCTAKTVPSTSLFAEPIRFVEDATDFLVRELMSEEVESELRKQAALYPWVDMEGSSTYFELSMQKLPECMSNVGILASKTYTRGLVLISVFYGQSLYCVLLPGEGDQPLLDVSFPDVSSHGQGLSLNVYRDGDSPFKRLTLWHRLEGGISTPKREVPVIHTLNVSSKNYEQTYCILRSSMDPKTQTCSVYHDTLFRFGSWCYAGRVQLVPSLNLQDVPFVIPALRMQQSRMDYYCDVNAVPTTSPFAPALDYIQRILPRLEAHVTQSEITLRNLMTKLESMGLGTSVKNWLDGDVSNSFYEFVLDANSVDQERLANVEIVVSKCYYASGVVLIVIVFQSAVYVSVLESNGENPLLDSRFPDVSGKGRGYQLESFDDGSSEWEELRKVSIWQTMSSLQHEMIIRSQAAAESKNDSISDYSGSESSRRINSTPAGEDDSKEASVTVTATVKEQPRSEAKPRASPVSSPAATTAAQNNTPKVAVLSTLSQCADVKPAEVKSISSPSVPRNSLPHHLPKMESLSNRLESIRSSMGSTGLVAPWDRQGNPLGGIGSSTAAASTRK